MSIYDCICKGLAEDWRKARSYDSVKKELNYKLDDALAHPDKDAWNHGFDTGYEIARQMFRGEKPMNEKEQWESFERMRNNAKSKDGGSK